MFLKVNSCCFVGNLVSDLSKKVFPSGAIKVTGRLAANGGKKKNGDMEVAYIPFQAWGGVADYLYNNCNEKGSKLGISGYMISDDPYEVNGEKRYPETYLKVDRVDIINKTNNKENENENVNKTFDDEIFFDV